MRTTRVLAIVAILGIALSFRASANVAYDSETTNTWFKVNAANPGDFSTAPWAKPSKGGEVSVVDSKIALDTDLDDPLIYTPTSATGPVVIVTAQYTATANADAPNLADTPQAALAVVANGANTNWYGLVKKDASVVWEKFTNVIPTVGETYTIHIDLNNETHRIRYWVGDTILGTGWYDNPKSATETKVTSVSFAGTGDIGDFGGDNITENTIAFKALTAVEGYDYTNGTISVSADIQGYENATAVLTVVDFGTGEEKTFDARSLGGESPASWDLSALTAGGIYDYTIEAKVGGETVATKTGTFTAAKWPADIWFGADASKPTSTERVKGGLWAKEPTIENNAYYVIEENSVFNVTDQDQGSNHVTRVDAKVTFETLVDGDVDMPEGGAIGGFVATTAGWKALTATTWEPLTGEIEPIAGTPYVIRAEVDFISDTKRVRYLVSEDDGETFFPLYNGTAQWINLAVQDKSLLAQVELQGSGKLAKFEATVADKALFEVNGKKFDTMAAALAEAGTEGTNTIKLLTNASVDPKTPGSYEIDPNGHKYMSGGKESTQERTVVVDEAGEPVVRPGKAVMDKVKTPDGASYKDTNRLRKFLEQNWVTAYTDASETATADATANNITNALAQVGENTLPLWQDYALGIEPTDSVAPVTLPTGDTDPANITLAIPAVTAATPSGDYTVTYKVVLGEGSEAASTSDTAGAIKIPLTSGTGEEKKPVTGTYKIKAVFTPVQ